jgi:hypothetical protein
VPKTFRLKMLPAGMTVSPAFPGENVEICTKGFYSSEDGNDFINAAEQITKCFAPHLFTTDGLRPSILDNLLAIIDRNCQVTLYYNELNQRVRAQAKRTLKGGERVTQNDVVDFDRVILIDATGSPIEIPSDCGVVLVLSAGWRKCIYFDFAPLQNDTSVRTDDLHKLFGRFLSYLCFQELYGINEAQWRRLIDWGWFPFIWMDAEDRKALVAFACYDREPTSLFEEVCRKFKTKIDDRYASWCNLPIVRDHQDFIADAKDSYLNDKYIACVQTLYPRIEGILRHLLHSANHAAHVNQMSMVNGLSGRRENFSTLLPQRFKEYMMTFYFRGFDGRQASGPLSRHTIAHGVSVANDYNFIRASLGFMIIDQIHYYLSDTEASNALDPSTVKTAQ